MVEVTGTFPRKDTSNLTAFLSFLTEAPSPPAENHYPAKELGGGGAKRRRAQSLTTRPPLKIVFDSLTSVHFLCESPPPFTSHLPFKFRRMSETPTTTTCQKSIAIHLPFVLQCASNLYCSTFGATELSGKGKTSVLLPFVSPYASHLYRHTPPICIAMLLGKSWWLWSPGYSPFWSPTQILRKILCRVAHNWILRAHPREGLPFRACCPPLRPTLMSFSPGVLGFAIFWLLLLATNFLCGAFCPSFPGICRLRSEKQELYIILLSPTKQSRGSKCHFRGVIFCCVPGVLPLHKRRGILSPPGAFRWAFKKNDTCFPLFCCVCDL